MRDSQPTQESPPFHHSQPQSSTGYPVVPNYDIMPPSLAIPTPQPPPMTIQITGDDVGTQLTNLFQLTNQLNTT
eukprot:12318618-Karenia_brevis.AAC.1